MQIFYIITINLLTEIPGIDFTPRIVQVRQEGEINMDRHRSVCNSLYWQAWHQSFEG